MHKNYLKYSMQLPTSSHTTLTPSKAVTLHSATHFHALHNMKHTTIVPARSTVNMSHHPATSQPAGQVQLSCKFVLSTDKYLTHEFKLAFHGKPPFPATYSTKILELGR